VGSVVSSPVHIAAPVSSSSSNRTPSSSAATRSFPPSSSTPHVHGPVTSSVLASPPSSSGRHTSQSMDRPSAFTFNTSSASASSSSSSIRSQSPMRTRHQSNGREAPKSSNRAQSPSPSSSLSQQHQQNGEAHDGHMNGKGRHTTQSSPAIVARQGSDTHTTTTSAGAVHVSNTHTIGGHAYTPNTNTNNVGVTPVLTPTGNPLERGSLWSLHSRAPSSSSISHNSYDSKRSNDSNNDGYAQASSAAPSSSLSFQSQADGLMARLANLTSTSTTPSNSSLPAFR
jgi:hypothetical protein